MFLDRKLRPTAGHAHILYLSWEHPPPRPPAVEQRLPNDRIRILKVQPGNLRQSHLYVRGHYDFFPSECIGPSRKKNRMAGCQIEIILDGLNETVHTDLCTDADTGKPRGMFRGRTWVRRFYEDHGFRTAEFTTVEECQPP
jgi:hypothetical protein